MQEREKLFEIGFLFVASSVLATLAAGGLLWILWFSGRRKWNLCGDQSPELITRLPQSFPRWTAWSFVLMFGVMLVVASLSLGRAASENKADPDVPLEISSTQVDPAELVDDISDASVKATEVEVLEEPKPKATAVSLMKQVKIHFVANLTALLVTLIFLYFVHGATLSHLTLIPTASDLRRGAVATVWILTPVLLINVVVSNFIQYQHTVTDLLAVENGVGTFAFLLFSAAFVTPIVEEFQFRLLLQGGLQKIADASTTYAPEDYWRPTSSWPIYVTSLIFALLHFGQGGAPIALFFLSIGLGFLYQRTGRLFPSIVVHMLLNGATLSMEFCRVNAGL